MKRIFCLILCLALVIPMIPTFSFSASAETLAYSWEFDSSVEGFGTNNSSKEAKDGMLVQTITLAKNNTWLLSPNNLKIDASVYRFLYVRAKNSTSKPGHFAMEATGTEKSAFTGKFLDFYEIPNDGEFHEYVVDLSSIADWKGTISRFRLRLSQWTCEGTVEVDYIRISDTGPDGTSKELDLISYADGGRVAAGGSAVFEAKPLGGAAKSIEFFANGVSIGTASAAPYQVTWTPDKAGDYVITAEANIGGEEVVSKEMSISVYNTDIIERSAYYWRFRGANQGWAGNNSTLTVDNDNLIQSVNSDKHNSFLLSPSGLAIDASVYRYIKIRVKADYSLPGRLAVQWVTADDTGWDTSWSTGSKTLEVGSEAVVADGLYHDYVIDLSSKSGWSGTITRLRVKVTPWQDTEQTAVATIDFIRVSDTLENGIDESDIPKPKTQVLFDSNTPLSALTIYNGAKYTDEIISADSDGTYRLPAGLYTYTAEAKASTFSKVHKNFLVTDADVAAGTKTIHIELPTWSTPGYWSVKTIFLPTDEITTTYFDDPAPEIKLASPAFEEGKDINDFTTQEELEAFVAAADKACDYMWSTTIGQTKLNQDILLTVFSKGAASNGSWSSIEDAAKALHAAGKPIVWVSAQVHGNEISGGEAALSLIAELCGEWGEEVLDKVSVIVVPRQNPDGARRNGRTPEGGNDINRDWVKFELVETQAISAAYRLFCPEVAVDAHEYGSEPTLYQGAYTYGAMDLLIATSTNASVPDSIAKLSESLYKSNVHSTLASYGIRSMEYYDGSISSTMSQSSWIPNRNTPSRALYPTFSFLLETLIPGGGYNSLTHAERRVKSHLISIQTIIETTVDNAGMIKELVDKERADLLAAAAVYDEDDVIILGQTTKVVPIEISYIDMLTNELKTATINFNSYSEGEVTNTVARPLAYVIPKVPELEVAIQRLLAMGADIEELPAGQVFEGTLQKYVVKSSKVSTSLDQQVYTNALDVDIVPCESITFDTSVYFVYMDVMQTNLIGAAMEPEHPLSLASFRVIDVADVAVGDTLPYYRYIGVITEEPEETETETETDEETKETSSPEKETEPEPQKQPKPGKLPFIGAGIGTAILAAVAAVVVILKKKK